MSCTMNVMNSNWNWTNKSKKQTIATIKPSTKQTHETNTNIFTWQRISSTAQDIIISYKLITFLSHWRCWQVMNSVQCKFYCKHRDLCTEFWIKSEVLKIREMGVWNFPKGCQYWELRKFYKGNIWESTWVGFILEHHSSLHHQSHNGMEFGKILERIS